MSNKDLTNILRPQKGKQEMFLSSSADIVIYGGSAGGGKTYGLLLEAQRHIIVKDFGVVIFRKELTQINKQGGLWDTAETIYPFIGGRGVEGNLVYHFDKYGTKIQFAHLARDVDLIKWQGTQIPLICFDELTHFTKKQFFYMLSRNRTVVNVKPYIRATTNPDPDSWVRKFIDWWIGEDGFPIEERAGVIRWLIHYNDEYHWFDTKEEAIRAFPTIAPKSVTFIGSTIYDNKILLEKNPEYISNLQALDRVEKARLLDGNWNVKLVEGDYFKREDFEIVDALPPLVKKVRCWDLAGTEPSATNIDPDYTVGMGAGMCADGFIYIYDIVRFRKRHSEVKRIFRNTVTQDGKSVFGTVPQDAGSAGKAVATELVKSVMGYPYRAKTVTGSKEVRAKPASGQAGVGNIKVLRASWNDEFFNELEQFPFGTHDDQVDTLADCIEELTLKRSVKVVSKPRIVK